MNNSFNKSHLILSFYNTYTANLFFLVIDDIIAPDNPLRFRKNLSERI